MIYNNILETIGNTPLVRLNRLAPLHVNILVKLEWTNPAGSVKDRVAKAMIESAEARGQLKKGDAVVEATSGNTGIGLAMVCAVKAYPLTIVMPDNVNIERIQILQGYGAKIILTPAHLGMKGCLEKVVALKLKDPKLFCPTQFVNPDNPKAHEDSTGPEIWRATEGKVDVLVAGMGTGGTISGTAKALKNYNSNIRVIGVEPEESPLLTKGYIGSHRLQGIGMSAGFVPPILAQDLIDEVHTANYAQAIEMVKKMAQEEGMFIGVSSGAILHAALEESKKAIYKDQTFVVILMDSGYRYLSEGIDFCK